MRKRLYIRRQNMKGEPLRSVVLSACITFVERCVTLWCSAGVRFVSIIMDQSWPTSVPGSLCPVRRLSLLPCTKGTEVFASDGAVLAVQLKHHTLRPRSRVQRDIQENQGALAAKKVFLGRVTARRSGERSVGRYNSLYTLFGKDSRPLQVVLCSRARSHE